MSSCIHPQRETTQSSEMTTDDSPTDTPGDQPATESAKPECTAAAAADAAAADRREKPEEYIDGLWEVEPVYYSQSSNYSNDNNTGPSSTLLQTNNGASGHPAQLESIRSRRGLIYKSVAESDCEYKCFQDYQGVLYRPGDHVFIETSQMEQPYLIGSITLFKMTKKDQLCVKVTRYFRPIDVPELSYSLVVQERKDLGNFDSTLQFHAREVFSSESSSTHPIHALRGKCSVRQVKDIRSVSASAEADFYLSTSTSIEPVHFFFCLNYNCDSGRLAAVQGEIRVGSAFQAKIPSCSSSTLSDEPDRDECLYKPGMLCVESEKNYVKMTRTFRTFSLLSNKRITPIERASRTGDLLHDDSLGVLHRCGYSVPEAVRTMHANDQHLTNDSSLLNADDMKRFGKGIKTYGKNFGKITRELLPFHQRDQLVSFYYLWKKSREATRPKPLARQRNAITARRGPRQITSYGAIHANAHHLLAAMVSSGCGGGGNGAPPTSINGSSSPTGNGGNSSLAPSAQQLATGATAAAATHDELMDYASASEAEVEHLGQESRACHHCFSVRSRDWHHAGHKRPLLCTECRLFYKRYGQMRPVDRPSTVPPCLHKTAGEGGGTNEDENEENDEPLGVRTRGAGRKERRRTPSVYDFNEATEGKVAEFRTPTKGELLLGVSNGGVLERRTTPQRSAKNNTTRKRTHRGSSTSGGDESSPLSKSAVKRAKAGITAAATANGSRTPSPRSDGQQQQSTNSEGVSKEAAGSSSTSSSSSSPEVGSGLQAAVGVKKEPIGEGEGETVLLANGVHKETLLLNGLSATGRSNTVSSGSGGGGGRVPLCDGKPVAKVEPLLDSAATATRKSGVGGQMELLKKADGGSPSKSSKANNNNNSKMSSKLAGATGARLLDGATCDAGGGEASSSSLMDSVAEGGVEGEDSSATMPSQDECGWKDTRFVRMWKRMVGLNMCSRTDLAYLDRTERYYRDKKLKEQQAALHQQQQDANAALATAVQQQQRHQQQAQQLQQHLHQAQQLEQQKQLASMQHILAGAVGRKEITQAEFEQLMALRVLPPPNGMMAAAAAAHAAVTATPSGLQPSAAAHLPPAATPFLASHLPLHTPPCMPPPFPGPQPPQMQSHQSSMQSGAPQNPAIAMAAAMAAAGAAIDPRMMTPQQLMILAGMEQQHKQMEQQFQKQQQQQQQQQQHHQQQQQQQQHQQHQQQQQQQQQQQKAAQSAQHHHGSITNGNANTSRQHLASHPGMGATPSGKQSLAGLPPATAAAMMTNSNSPSQHQQMVENAQRMQLLGNAQQQQQQLAAAFAAHQHQIAQQQQHQQHQHNSSQNSHPLAFGMDGMPQMNPAHLLQIMANDPQSRLFFERLQADFQQQQQSQLQQQQAAALAAQQQAQQQQVQQQQQHQAMMATMQHLAALAASDPVLYSTLVQNPALQQQHQQLQLQGQHPPPWQQLIAAGPGSQQQQAAMNAQPQLAMQELFRRMQHEQMGGGGAAR